MDQSLEMYPLSLKVLRKQCAAFPDEESAGNKSIFSETCRSRVFPPPGWLGCDEKRSPYLFQGRPVCIKKPRVLVAQERQQPWGCRAMPPDTAVTPPPASEGAEQPRSCSALRQGDPELGSPRRHCPTTLVFPCVRLL